MNFFATIIHNKHHNLSKLKRVSLLLIINQIYIIFCYLFYLAINKVTLLGRVGADPQKRGTEEHPVVVFSLATHQNYINNNEGNTINIYLFYRLFNISIIIIFRKHSKN